MTPEQRELDNLRNIVGALALAAGGVITLPDSALRAVRGWTYEVYLSSLTGDVRIRVLHPQRVVAGSVVKEDGEEGKPGEDSQPGGPFSPRRILGGHIQE